MHLLLLASLQCGLARPAQYLTSYELKLREHANIIKHHQTSISGVGVSKPACRICARKALNCHVLEDPSLILKSESSAQGAAKALRLSALEYTYFVAFEV